MPSSSIYREGELLSGKGRYDVLSFPWREKWGMFIVFTKGRKLVPIQRVGEPIFSARRKRKKRI